MIRVAILAPQPAGAPAGNEATVRRLVRSLPPLGVVAVPIALPGRPEPEVLAEARAARPDIVHAIHASKTGPAAARISRALGVPFAVTPAGTDLHLDALDPVRRAELEEVLAGAGAVIAGERSGMEGRLRALGVPAAKVVRAPKGVDLPRRADVEDLLDRDERCPGGAVLFLLPAGWREVKNNLFPLDPLAEVLPAVPALRLRFVGPAIELAYRARFDPARFPFAEDGGAIPPDRMDGEYRAASVVLNVSHSEGGANAVLEAMAWGRPVLAAAIDANIAFLDHDEDAWDRSTGVLYRAPPSADPRRRLHDAADFAAKARRLAFDPRLRAGIGRRAREAAERDHSPRAEAEAVLRAYRLCGV